MTAVAASAALAPITDRSADAQLPRLRRDVKISDANWHGANAVHLVRDTVAGRTFEVGTKEHFVMTRLDGTRSATQLQAEYAEHLGRRLDDRGLWQLLGQLGKRRLLEGFDNDDPSSAPASHHTGESDRRSDATEPRNTLLRAEIRLAADPEKLSARLAAVVKPSAHSAVAVLLLFAAGATATVASGGLADRVVQAWMSPVAMVVAVLLLWLSTAVHELAHGVVATLQGGRVAAYGIRWRLPVLIPFCRVEDYLFIPGRRGRIAAALAGPAVHLVAAGACAALWLAGLRTGTVADILALVWAGNVMLTVANLVPLAPLDGYVVLSHATGVLRLTTQSQQYAGVHLRAVVRRSDDEARTTRERYPARLRRIYLGYALLAPLLVLALATGAVFIAAALIPQSAGPWRYAGPIAAVLLVITGMATTQRNRTETS